MISQLELIQDKENFTITELNLHLGCVPGRADAMQFASLSDDGATLRLAALRNSASLADDGAFAEVARAAMRGLRLTPPHLVPQPARRT